MELNLLKKFGPIIESEEFENTKDPCPVFDGVKYHIFGSGGSTRTERWEIYHATAERITGPWKEEVSINMEGVEGERVAAPGVIFDKENHLFHMFIQTDFITAESSIEYLVSDNGKDFLRINTALTHLFDREVGLYDPHPFEEGNEKYLVYSATPISSFIGISFSPKPDIYIAKSKTNEWTGPWEVAGKILDHVDIATHHNQRDHVHYEWGIEGPQLIGISPSGYLLNATCFLPEGRFGTRQRVFFAVSRNILGPYKTLGPVINEELEDWESGENGHAAAIIEDNILYLFYQARSRMNEEDVSANSWRYGIAQFDTNSIKNNIPNI